MEDVYELSVVMQGEVYARDRLEKELKEVEEAIQHKECTFEEEIDKYRQMEQHLSDLKDNMKEHIDLLDYSIMAFDEVAAKHNIYDSKVIELSELASKYVQNCRSLQESIGLLEIDMNNVAMHIDQLHDVNLSSDIAELAQVRDICSSQASTLSDTKEYINTLESRIAHCRENIVTQKIAYTEAREKCEQLSHNLNDIIAKIKSTDTRVAQLRTKSAELEEERAKTVVVRHQQMQNMTTNIEAILMQISTQQTAVEATTRALEALQAKHLSIVTNMHCLQNKHAKLTAQISELDQRVSMQYSTNVSAQQQLAFTRSQIANNKKLLENYRNADVYSDRRIAMDEELRVLKANLLLLQSAVRDVQEQVVSKTHPETLPLFDAISKEISRGQQLASIVSSLNTQNNLTNEEYNKITKEIAALREQEEQQRNDIEELERKLQLMYSEEQEVNRAVASAEAGLAEQRQLLRFKEELREEEATTSKIALEKENEMVFAAKQRKVMHDKVLERNTRQRVAFMEHEVEIRVQDAQNRNRQSQTATLEQLQRELQEADKQFQTEVKRQEHEHNKKMDDLKREIDSLQKALTAAK